MSIFTRAFAAWIVLGWICTAHAQDTVIPHVPTAAELVDGVSIIVDGDGNMATASGTNGVTVTGDVEPFQYVMRNSDGTAYIGQYGPRAVTNWAASPLTEYWPQQLVRGLSSNMYYAATRIYPYQTNYPGFNSGTNHVYPVPGVHDQWVLFASDGLNGAAGAAGANGATGASGANGATNIAWSVWNATTGYFTTTPTVVQYGGQWYHLIANSSNEVPLTTTSKWEVSVAQGLNGTVLGTNIFYRGAFDASTAYNTNDAVDYDGSYFVVGPTNVSVVGAFPDTSAVPTNRANWNVLMRKGTTGATGATGAQGPSGNVITNINNYQTIVLTGLQWIALGSASNGNVAGLYIQPGTNLVMTNDGFGASFMTIPTNSSISAFLPYNSATNNVRISPTNGSIVEFCITNQPVVANTYVLLTGETNLVNLTNATVRAKTPSAGNDVATKDYVDSGGSAGVTNAINKMNINGVDYTGLLQLNISDVGTGSSAVGPTVTLTRVFYGFVTAMELAGTNPAITPSTLTKFNFCTNNSNVKVDPGALVDSTNQQWRLSPAGYWKGTLRVSIGQNAGVASFGHVSLAVNDSIQTNQWSIYPAFPADWALSGVRPPWYLVYDSGVGGLPEEWGGTIEIYNPSATNRFSWIGYTTASGTVGAFNLGMTWEYLGL